MPLTTCFNLVSPELVRQLDWMIVVAPFQLKNILSYSILFCFVLFYSIPLPCAGASDLACGSVADRPLACHVFLFS